MKRSITILAGFVLVVLLAWFFRENIYRSIGNYLIDEDELQHVEVIFLLGGGPFDRGNEAAKIFNEGYADYIVCTGGNITNLRKALNIRYREARISRLSLIKNNKIPLLKIKVIPKGTSTKEESELILKYCIDHDIKKTIILSSKFHTLRVRKVFEPVLEKNGIEVIIRGAPSTKYSEHNWWKKEAGLIMVNNEYVKLVYYFF